MYPTTNVPLVELTRILFPVIGFRKAKHYIRFRCFRTSVRLPIYMLRTSGSVPS